MTIIVWIFVASDLFNWKFEVLHIPTLQCVDPRETEGNRSKDPCFHPSMMAKVSRDHRRVGIKEKRAWLLYVFGLNHALYFMYYIESSKFQVQLVFFPELSSNCGRGFLGCWTMFFWLASVCFATSSKLQTRREWSRAKSYWCWYDMMSRDCLTEVFFNIVWSLSDRQYGQYIALFRYTYCRFFFAYIFNMYVFNVLISAMFYCKCYPGDSSQHLPLWCVDTVKG